jgi:hypothetical protein
MKPESFPILTVDGEVNYYQLDQNLANSLVPLPYQHDRYFVIGPATIFLPTAALIFTRVRPTGVLNANTLMLEAAAGKREARKPISVRAFGNGKWQIVDGNSTAVNGLTSGWSDIPAEISVEKPGDA